MKDNSTILIGVLIVVVLALGGWQLQQRQAEATRERAFAARMLAQAEEAKRQAELDAQENAREQAQKEAEQLRASFAKIKKGMSEDDVLKLMGGLARVITSGQALPMFVDLNIKTLEWGTKPLLFRCTFLNGQAIHLEAPKPLPLK